MIKICTRGAEYFKIFTCILIMVFAGSCSHLDEGSQQQLNHRELNELFNQGKYEALLGRYEELLKKDPSGTEKTLFEMGIVYSYPGNQNKDYQKSIACFEKLIRQYPESSYRRDSEMMIFQIKNVMLKDRTIADQQSLIDGLKREVRDKDAEIDVMQRKIEALEQKIFTMRKEPADKVLIEKKERRLTLLSRGEVIKTYKIALGGNPIGPKERRGDNKTPEGMYVIDSRNRDSQYHLALHISYPNEKDKKRARDLGTSPGGDIMIHGIKNGYSWVGSSHTEIDWTKGCIAVTDDEIEEIDRFVPNGTVVEIRP
ncbi:MAG TPA: L,D-transpeptidase family protein [Syntrophorhabdaceae bacterium]|nr:L,D-transpeptidase family protein [Syntrophorhabdaceae bacterium]